MDYAVKLPAVQAVKQPAGDNGRRGVERKPFNSKMSAKRILVVDDEPSVRESIQIMLDGQGHQVDFVTSGAEALDRRPTENYDVTVTDYRMTGMTGLDLAKELKRRRPGHSVILMSGSPPIDSGGFCDAVLLKPFSVSDLREAVVSPHGEILIQLA